MQKLLIDHKFENIFKDKLTAIIEFKDDFAFLLSDFYTENVEISGTWRVVSKK